MCSRSDILLPKIHSQFDYEQDREQDGALTEVDWFPKIHSHFHWGPTPSKTVNKTAQLRTATIPKNISTFSITSKTGTRRCYYKIHIFHDWFVSYIRLNNFFCSIHLFHDFLTDINFFHFLPMKWLTASPCGHPISKSFSEFHRILDVRKFRRNSEA